MALPRLEQIFLPLIPLAVDRLGKQVKVVDTLIFDVASFSKWLFFYGFFGLYVALHVFFPLCVCLVSLGTFRMSPRLSHNASPINLFNA